MTAHGDSRLNPKTAAFAEFEAELEKLEYYFLLFFIFCRTAHAMPA
eukprot:CAMPEP_0115113866 /NCGR_PEP_ID=MMETSP0227-20121206/41678_1 /TAXON_ID=89957 /ORGANISM="Polarella glacialis, Strain CCMP 1383" /LENGTH=45 /DNA_ID= /DNA_START= /DNA_END= /DNA_ORIENTATION=